MLEENKKMMFLTSWPHGELKIVEIIQRREGYGRLEKDYYYIRYESGKTDTTNSDFLFEIPESLGEKQ